MIVTARTRTADGQWWYECEAIVPARYEHADGSTEPKGVPSPISVAADDITPIPGEDYEAVPTVGAVTGRQWRLERVRQHREDGRSWCLHRRDCWQAGGELRRITTREAVERLAAGGTVDCDICRPRPALPR